MQKAFQDFISRTEDSGIGSRGYRKQLVMFVIDFSLKEYLPSGEGKKIFAGSARYHCS